MAGVAELEGDEVGDIDDVVDRPLADGFEAFGEPGGAGADLDALDDAGGEAWADLRGGVAEGELLGDGAAASGEFGGGEFEASGHRSAGGGGDFSRQTDMAEAVASVGGNLHIEEGVAARERTDFFEREPRGGEELVGFVCREVARAEVLIDPAEADIHGAEG